MAGSGSRNLSGVRQAHAQVCERQGVARIFHVIHVHPGLQRPSHVLQMPGEVGVTATVRLSTTRQQLRMGRDAYGRYIAMGPGTNRRRQTAPTMQDRPKLPDPTALGYLCGRVRRWFCFTRVFCSRQWRRKTLPRLVNVTRRINAAKSSFGMV